MKRIALSLIVAAAAVVSAAVQPKTPPKKAASRTATKSPSKTAAKTAPKPKAETEVPPGSKLISPGTYRWVDPKGVAWIYQVTPFGLMKAPEQNVPAEPIPTDWKITDLGESLAFEKPYPFGGAQKWTRKKSELTEMEQAVWKQSQSGSDSTSGIAK